MKYKMTLQEALSKLNMMNANAIIAVDAAQEDETAMAVIALFELADDDQTEVVMVSGGKLDDLKSDVISKEADDESEDIYYDGDYVCVTVIDSIIYVLIDGALNSEVPA